MKLRKGDKVVVIAGKDKGKEGVIDRVYDKSNTVLIQDINMVKKHVRKSEEMPQGGIIDMPKPINASNVMLKDGKSMSRVGYQNKDGKKVRVAKKSKTVLK
jgi:large subunit ribosomal protein L24